MEYYSSLPKRQRRRERDTTATANANEVVSSPISSSAVLATTATKDDPASSDDEDEMLGQLIYNSSRTAQLWREQQQQQEKSEGGEELAPQQHTATVTIANPPNDPRVCKSKCPSHRTNKEIESAPKKKKKKKKRVQKLRKSFEQRIDDLWAYKEKHGHVNISQKEDKSLYGFCKNMRGACSNPEKSTTVINDDRIASLDALGFNWTVRTRENAAKKSFEQRLEDLRAYKEKHGHVKVKKSDDKSLYDFCIHMRCARNNPEKSTVALTGNRIASLDALGFEWSMNNGIKYRKKLADSRPRVQGRFMKRSDVAPGES